MRKIQIIPQQVFEVYTNNEQYPTVAQQSASYQLNLSIGKLHKSRLKAAIQKQIIEFAHRQSSVQQLQDMY